MFLFQGIAALAAKVASASTIAQAAAGLGITVAGVTGAGAAGVLPGPVQHGVASVIEAVTPFHVRDSSGVPTRGPAPADSAPAPTSDVPVMTPEEPATPTETAAPTESTDTPEHESSDATTEVRRSTADDNGQEAGTPEDSHHGDGEQADEDDQHDATTERTEASTTSSHSDEPSSSEGTSDSGDSESSGDSHGGDSGHGDG